ARECFEEAGVLLARRRSSGAALEVSSEVDALRFARHRRDLLAGRRPLAEILDAEGLALDLGGVAYVSHWITPPGPPRRFDTRFFVAPMPGGQSASHDTSETVDSVWTTPAAALERRAAGEIHLVFPTIKNLEALARHGATAGLLAAARAVESVPVIAPARIPEDPELPCPT
ncbi:MAG: NUDIX hydrolase, partial [Acidimicrobiia bacterium]